MANASSFVVLLYFIITTTCMATNCNSIPTSQNICGPSDNLQCTDFEICKEKTLECQDNADCSIQCTTSKSTCNTATFDVTGANSLTLQCGIGNDAIELCRDSTVHSTNLNGNIQITCEGSQNSCSQMNVFATGSKSITINCDGFSSCQYMTIDCGINCTLNCNNSGNNVCQGTSLTCGTGQCIINCSGTGSKCVLIGTIDASQASTFTCIGTTDECSDVYDKLITSPPTNPTNIPTTIPSVNPTAVPTLSPSTSINPTVIPTLFPVQNPTNILTTIPSVNPTAVPTLSPSTSINPTVIPTLFPVQNMTTKYPSLTPTIYPSVSPTIYPSLQPTIYKNEGRNDEVITTYTNTNQPKHGSQKSSLDTEGTVIIILVIIIIVLISAVSWLLWFRNNRKKNKLHTVQSGSEFEMTKLQNGENVVINGENDHEADESESIYGQGNNIITKGGDESDVELEHNDYNGFYVKVIMDYIAGDEDQLDLQQYGLFYVLKTLDSGWWFGCNNNGKDGWFPSNYLRKCNLLEQNKLKQEQKIQTKIGEMDRNKYINIELPPVIQLVLITTDDNDEVSESSDHITTGQ
eukprot:262830_1